MESSIPSDIAAKMENQKESLMAYQDFSNLLSKDINGNLIYPDNYAGEYIDENGDLVFFVC